jgi:predicted anti-sigma-YlaC factor YlaD
MNCNLCEERMSEYLEEALDQRERQSIDLHLQSCTACSELLFSMQEILGWAKTFSVVDPPAWLPLRIIANTPRLERERWSDTITAGFKWILNPRAAMGLFTATLVLSWLGNMTGISPDWSTVVRDPAGIYYEAQGAVNRAYDEAVRRYYRSPLLTEIKTRIEQLREIS